MAKNVALILLFLLVTRLATASTATIDEDELTAFTVLDCEVGPACSIATVEILTSSEGWFVELVEALVTRHEVKGLFAEVALPSYSLVTSIRWKAFRFFTLLANDVATVEATATAADGSHPILDKVHKPCAFEAEEVVQFIWALLALDVFEQLEWKLVAEHEEVSVTARALDKGRLRPHQLHLTLWVNADDLRVHRSECL